MAYTVTSDTLGLALGTCLDFATDVHEAITKARQMFDIGFVNISIKNETGRGIEGPELLACIMGTRTITEDLRAMPL